MTMTSHKDSTQRAKSAAAPVRGVTLQRKCACGGSSGLTGSCTECEKKKLVGQPLQTKLRINEPGDQYEQEADRMAEQVMRMADSDFGPSHLQSAAMVQRRVAAEEIANTGSMIQRVEASGEVPASEGDKPSGPTQDEGSRCPSWRQDPQSISKRAAETYVQNDMTPPSQATVERIDCEPPPATPLCFYDYACPNQDLVLTKRECKSAKPAAPAGPPLVAQRRAAPGASGSINAGPMVNNVLAKPGQPLDATTREFFSAAFRPRLRQGACARRRRGRRVGALG